MGPPRRTSRALFVAAAAVAVASAFASAFALAFASAFAAAFVVAFAFASAASSAFASDSGLLASAAAVALAFPRAGGGPDALVEARRERSCRSPPSDAPRRRARPADAANDDASDGGRVHAIARFAPRLAATVRSRRMTARARDGVRSEPRAAFRSLQRLAFFRARGESGEGRRCGQQKVFIGHLESAKKIERTTFIGAAPRNKHAKLGLVTVTCAGNNHFRKTSVEHDARAALETLTQRAPARSKVRRVSPPPRRSLASLASRRGRRATLDRDAISAPRTPPIGSSSLVSKARALDRGSLPRAIDRIEPTPSPSSSLTPRRASLLARVSR
jgi:hypothetical protein